MEKGSEQAILAAFPGDDPTVVKVRLAILRLMQMAERSDWSLDFIHDRIRFLLDSPMEGALDGVLIEESLMLALRLEAVGMEARIVARDLLGLKTEWYNRKPQ